jgi:signal peptidase I
VAGARRSASTNSLVELVTIVAVALGLALGIQAFLVKPFRIPSESMVPTLEIGQRVLVDRVSYRFSDPTGATSSSSSRRRASRAPAASSAPATSPCPKGTPERSDTNFIKRVVGLPGRPPEGARGVGLHQRQEAGRAVRPARRQLRTCNLPREITIPKGYYYMMGDNRGESADSREWGPVPKKWIIGKAFMTYWPPGRIGLT